MVPLAILVLFLPFGPSGVSTPQAFFRSTGYYKTAIFYMIIFFGIAAVHLFPPPKITFQELKHFLRRGHNKRFYFAAALFAPLAWYATLPYMFASPLFFQTSMAGLAMPIFWWAALFAWGYLTAVGAGSLAQAWPIRSPLDLFGSNAFEQETSKAILEINRLLNRTTLDDEIVVEAAVENQPARIIVKSRGMTAVTELSSEDFSEYFNRICVMADLPYWTKRDREGETRCTFKFSDSPRIRLRAKVGIAVERGPKSAKLKIVERELNG